MDGTGRSGRPGTRPGLNTKLTVLKAFHEVSGQLFTRQKFNEAFNQQAHSVAAFRDAVIIATKRYRAGHANYF